MNLFDKMANLILAFLTRLAAETNFRDKWRNWALNFFIWSTKNEYECQFDEIELRIWKRYASKDEIEWKIDEIEWRDDENVRENL